MILPARFLHSLAQALSTMTLYGEGHPARARAVGASYEQLQRLQETDPRPQFSFLGDEVVYGQHALRELGAWDWGMRLAAAGIQRLEFEDRASREEYEAFLDELLARLAPSAPDTSEARPMRPSSIRFGTVGIRGDAADAAEPVPDEPLRTATIAYTLGEEARTVQWMHGEVQTHGELPLLEAEAVVRSLAVAMHADSSIVLPLLQLKEFDQYTTTHSLNVSVLTMALAEFLELSPADVRAFGVAGLLHDIGKVRVPHEILVKPGKLSDEERAIMQRHPVEGARLIFSSDHQLDLAAVVAYEHHIMLDGGGYPTPRFARPCHRASMLVHVCDVYDALRTRRPYRDAWSSEKTLHYLEERAGSEFEPEVARAFVSMMRRWERRISTLAPDGETPAGG